MLGFHCITIVHLLFDFFFQEVSLLWLIFQTPLFPSSVTELKKAEWETLEQLVPKSAWVYQLVWWKWKNSDV